MTETHVVIDHENGCSVSRCIRVWHGRSGYLVSSTKPGNRQKAISVKRGEAAKWLVLLRLVDDPQQHLAFGQPRELQRMGAVNLKGLLGA